jgi:hypothetical protein
LKRFSFPKASNSTALEPSDAGKVPVLGQSLAAGHQGFSCTSLKVVAENLCPAANFVLGQASFVPLATTLSELSDHGKWNAKISHWVFNPKCGMTAISQLYFEKCQQSAAALCVPLELEIPLLR